ncbi:MAG: GNAT family N-acetyltransferase [Eubacteriales bacterium]|nr:GNAT family N-acetyltransferase [Eubacteriales bacterium]
MSGTVPIKTERLLLRPHVIEDADQVYALFGADEKMYEYSGWNPYATPEMAKEYVQRCIDSYNDEYFFGWAIEADRRLIGTVGAYDYDKDKNSIELGISIARNSWGKGYATEAVKAVIGYLAHEKQIRTITAWCASKNIGSKRAMEKNGMKFTGAEKGALKINGKTFDKLNFAYEG